jgi:hypothetical protein
MNQAFAGLTSDNELGLEDMEDDTEEDEEEGIIHP